MLVEQMLLDSGRPAYLLDGDNLRHGLNGDLGFSTADRDENVRRVARSPRCSPTPGWSCSCPLISPLAEHRGAGAQGARRAGLRFVEVFVDTPLEECERRDPKGLYAKARAGEITGFTGIDGPYEPPKHPDLRLTPDRTVDELAAAGHRHDRARSDGEDHESTQTRWRRAWRPRPASCCSACAPNSPTPPPPSERTRGTSAPTTS